MQNAQIRCFMNLLSTGTIPQCLLLGQSGAELTPGSVSLGNADPNLAPGECAGDALKRGSAVTHPLGRRPTLIGSPVGHKVIAEGLRFFCGIDGSPETTV
jgi:hypothetical protein